MTKLLRIFYLGEVLAELEWERNSTRVVTAGTTIAVQPKEETAL